MSSDELFHSYFQEHIKELARTESFSEEYYNSHKKRFCKIFSLIPKASSNSFAIELGATSLFQPLLSMHYGYARVMGTIFSDKVEEKKYVRSYNLSGSLVQAEAVSINLESELFPLEDESVDFVLCSEVLEHLDIDPMFMLTELNRILKKRGRILLTTPNCCSARNFWKIANGYRPHFFMQYERSRSPYRHNIEWDIHGVYKLLISSGFSITSQSTADVFEEKSLDGLHLLAKLGLPTNDRGDCIFVVAEKTSGVLDRWPGDIYV